MVSAVATYFIHPQFFTPQSLAVFLQRFEGLIWFAFLTVSILRGFTLLPSTPLVIAGTLLFPSQPYLVLAVSIVGILLSSSMIYWFSDLLGFSEFFEHRKPEMIHKLKVKLEHPFGFAFVALWAFFPLVPTDLVCYVAGVTRMNFGKFIFSIGSGETILCLIYIFGGAAMIRGWFG